MTKKPRYTVMVTYRYESKGTEVFGVFTDLKRAEEMRDGLNVLGAYEARIKPIFPEQSTRSVIDRLRTLGYTLLPIMPSRPGSGAARRRRVA